MPIPPPTLCNITDIPYPMPYRVNKMLGQSYPNNNYFLFHTFCVLLKTNTFTVL